MPRATTATIDLAALSHNLGLARTLLPGARIMALLKADGYGHGLLRVGRALADADAFGVDGFSDARRLRMAGLRQRAVVLPDLFDAESDSRGYARYGGWLCIGAPLYGLGAIAGESCAGLGFKPAMILSTRLIAINRIDAGECVGYSGTWECPEDMTVGVAAVGFGDGYPRNAPAGTAVMVNGVLVPIVGRVSMDLMTLDLRSMPSARVGDPVTLWGSRPPVEEVAAACATVGAQLTCAITPRVVMLEGRACNS